MAKRNRRNDIKVAAQAEFVSNGFAGARIERIARRAGVNKQLIFYYFKSKAGLYDAVRSEAQLELASATRPAEPGADRSTEQLRTVFSTFCDSLAERPDLVRLLVRDAGDEGDAPPLAHSVIEAGVARIAGVISQGQGLGYFRDDANPAIVARHAVVLAIGYLGLMDRRSTTGPGDRPIDWVQSVAEFLTRGLAW